MRSGLAVACLGVAIAGALAIAAACNDPEQYVFSAAPFDPVNLCLGPYQAVDVVSGGTGQSTCAPTCFVNGTSVYVSTVCPPFPDPTMWDESGENPACPAALSAYARMDLCSPDGGSSNPWVMPQDSGMTPAVDAAEGGGSMDDSSTDDDSSMDDSSMADSGSGDAPTE
jgi:hypothetical protein